MLGVTRYQGIKRNLKGTWKPWKLILDFNIHSHSSVDFFKFEYKETLELSHSPLTRIVYSILGSFKILYPLCFEKFLCFRIALDNILFIKLVFSCRSNSINLLCVCLCMSVYPICLEKSNLDRQFL